jgi:hypothetical protein
MNAGVDYVLEALARYEAINNERSFVAAAVSGLLLRGIFGEDWARKRLILNDKPDPWMLNGNDAWLATHPVAPPDLRRVTYSSRVVRLANALFTIIGKVDGFERLRERFLTRNDTRSSFLEAEIASLLVHNGCSVSVIGESGVRGQDFDLLATVMGTQVSVEVSAIAGGRLSINTVLNKLNGKRDQVPPDRPAVLYVRLPDTWMPPNSERGFLVLDAAVRRFMVKSKRINAIVFIGERVTPVDGGGGLHQWLAPVYNNYPRHLIPDYSVFSLKRDKWGVEGISVSFLDKLRAKRHFGTTPS